MNSKITFLRHACLLFTEELAELLQNLQASEQVICQVWSALVAANMEGSDLTGMITEYTREAQTRDKLLKTLLNVYEAEIQRLRSTVSEDHLSGHQKATIKDEIRVLEGLCNTNIRDGSAQEAYENITPSIFHEFTQAVQEKCPLIHELIETLVLSNQQERNVHKTNSHKMLCGLQTLAFMVNIRNSNARNCFPLLFGLLCISYGAGKQFIDMLQSMGLSLHWNTM